jgi:Tfp pilus assembly protein PilO
MKGKSTIKKRFIIVLIACALFLSIGPTATFMISTNYINELADSNSTIIGNYKHYSEFAVNDNKIRLYTETTLSAEDAIKAFPNAYELVSSEAEIMGISTSLDDPKFQSFAKIYACLFENGSVALVNECHEFASFVDYYENIAKNQKIIEAISLTMSPSSIRQHIESVKIEELMPTRISPTVASGQTTS